MIIRLTDVKQGMEYGCLIETSPLNKLLAFERLFPSWRPFGGELEGVFVGGRMSLEVGFGVSKDSCRFKLTLSLLLVD